MKYFQLLQRGGGIIGETITKKTHVWSVVELDFISEQKCKNPYTDVEAFVVFASPGGERYKVPCFWDGEDKWKARFAPPLPGCWSWEATSNNAYDNGFNGKKGEFHADEYQGENPVYKHGFLKVNENNRGFINEDGTPFFWLGDTVWSSPSKATVDEWEEYIAFRRRQGFNIYCFWVFIGLWAQPTLELKGHVQPLI